MFTGRMLSLFVMALVVFYPIEKGWAQTIPTSPQNTGFVDAIFPTALAISPKKEERILSFQNLHGEHWSCGYTVELTDVVQSLFEGSTCKVRFSEHWDIMPDRRADQADASDVGLLFGTGNVECTIDISRDQEEQRVSYRATYNLDFGKIVGLLNERAGKFCEGFIIPISVSFDDEGDLFFGFFSTT